MGGDVKRTSGVVNKTQLGSKVKAQVYNLSTILIFIIVITLFTIINAYQGNKYLTVSNLSVIINQASFLAMLGIAQMVVILTGGINLSIGAIMVFTSIIAGPMLLETNGYFFLIPMIVMIMTGAATGLVNGVLITRLKIPAFVATFSVMYIFRGLAWIIQGKTVLYRINSGLRFLAMGKLFNIGGFTFTMPMLICLIIIVLTGFLLKKTTFGRKIYFTGSNPIAARFSGIPVNKVIIIVHILSGALAGFCGIMYAARVNAAEPGMYAQAHFDAISVALIGGVAMSGGFGNVWETAVGALIISAIQSGMNSTQVASELQTLVLGSLIILSVFINQYLTKRKIDAINKLSSQGEKT